MPRYQITDSQSGRTMLVEGDAPPTDQEATELFGSAGIDQFTTKLSAGEEKKFQQWKETNAPNDSGADYDLRGAFKAGLSPNTDGHWPDTFKKPNHPTFSDQSIYAAAAPELAGSWNGDQYVPPTPAIPGIPGSGSAAKAARALQLAKERGLAQTGLPVPMPEAPKLSPEEQAAIATEIERKRADREPAAEALASVLGFTGGIPAPMAKVLLTKGGHVGDVAAGVVPAVTGSIVGTVIEPGGGTAAGGAAGALAGESLAQARQYFRGERDTVGKARLAAAGIAGAIPVGGPMLSTAPKVILTRAAQGAGISGGADLAGQLGETGKVDLGELAKSTAFGAIFGGATGGTEVALTRRAVLQAIRKTPEFAGFKGSDSDLVSAVRTKLSKDNPPAEPVNVTPQNEPTLQLEPAPEATEPAATAPAAPPSPGGAEGEFTAAAGMAEPTPPEATPAGTTLAETPPPPAADIPHEITTPASPESEAPASAPVDASDSIAGQSDPGIAPEPAAVSAGGQAPVEVAPSIEAVKPKGNGFSVGVSPDGAMDLLSHIEELGGIGTPGSVRHAGGGEYDGFNETFGNGPARLLRRKGAQAVDTLMQELQSTHGYNFAGPDAFYQAVNQAVAARQKVSLAIAKQTYEGKVSAALFGNAGRAAKLKAPAPVSSDSLAVGDALRVHGELYTVGDLDPNDGSITLQGAATIKVAPGTPLFPDNGKVITGSKAPAGGANPFEPSRPYVQLPDAESGRYPDAAVSSSSSGAGQVPAAGGNPGPGRDIGVDPATYLADPLKYAGPLSAELAKSKSISSIVADHFSGALPSWEPVGKVINSPADVGALMAPLRNPHGESYKVMVIGPHNVVRHAEVIHVGDLSTVSASLAAILRVVQKTTARRIILSHNHPGGDPTPSPADIASHNLLRERLSDHGVSVLDNVITNGHAAYSLAQNRLVEMDHAAPAPWERIPRMQLKRMDDQALVASLASQLRQRNPEAKFIFYLNRQMRLTGLEQVPASMPEEPLLRQIEAGAAREGGASVIVAARSRLDTSPRWLQKKLAQTNIDLVDVVTDLEGSHLHELTKFRDTTPPAAPAMEDQSFGQLDQNAPIIAYAKGKPNGYAKVNLAHLQNIKIVQMPELVRLVRELTGQLPQIRKLRGNRLGQFSSGDATITLDARIFVDQLAAAKTLAHEIGHLVDYLPHANLKRGNLLGRLHSLRQFLKNTLGVTTVTNKELRDELLKLTQWWKPYDPLSTPAWFKSYRESAPELYADALSVLFNSPAELKARAPKFWAELFANLNKKPDVQKELMDTWAFLNKPHLQVLERRADDIKKMFAQGEEILLRKEAERNARYATFRGWNDRFRQEIFDVYDPLVNRAQKLEKTGTQIPEKFNPRLLFDEHPLAADNANYRMLQQMWGGVVQPAEAAQFTLHELGEYLFLQRVLNERFAETMATTGRAELANPLGLNPETARLGLLRMRLQAGDVRFTRLTAAAAKFHDLVFDSIKRAVVAGVYSQKTFNEVLAPNKSHYVTFAVLDHLQDYVPAGLRMQQGTFKEIANPFTTTLMKTISLNRLTQLQLAKQGAVQFLQQYDPGAIAAAPVAFDGARWHVAPPKEPDKATLELLADGKPAGFHVDPAIAEMFDKLPNATVSALTTVLNWPFRQLIYPLIIKYNPAFQLVLSPAKDLRRTIVNMPGAQGLRYAGEFVRNYLTFLGLPATEAGTAVRAYLRGEPHPLIAEMIAKQAIGTPLDNFAVDLGRHDKMEALLRDYGLLPEEKQRGFLRTLMTPARALAERLEFAGLTFEMLPKVTAYKILTRDLGWSRKEAAYFARNNVAVPNIYKKGKHVQVLDVLTPFFKISLNGLRADLALAKNPKTAGGWWFRWALSDGIWTMLQAAAALGLLGAGIKELFDGVSDYNKTNYNVLPVGSTQGGEYGKRVVYLRFPRDPTHRLMSGLLYQSLVSAGTRAMGDKDPKSFLAPSVSMGADQVPGLNPILKIGSAWRDFLEGQNPMDGFRGKPILSNAEWLTGGWDAYKKMTSYTLQNTGVMNFVSWDPTAASASEMTLSAVPGLNRFIQTTDAGYRERQEEQLKDEARNHAEIKLGMPNNVQSLLTEYFWLNSVGAKARTLEQTERLMVLGAWHNRIYKPYADVASAEQTFGRKLDPGTKKALETASQPFERQKR